MKKFFVFGGVIIFVAIIFILFVVSPRRGINQIIEQSSQKTIVADAEWKSQTNGEGEVSVTVTPRIGARWDFAIALNTHSRELTYDFAKIAFLVDDRGKEYAPAGASGDPAGGHHREGVVNFVPFASSPKTLKLIIRGVGDIPERTFLWISRL